MQWIRTEEYAHSIDSHQEGDEGSWQVDQAVLEMDQRDLGGRGLALRHGGGQKPCARSIGSS